MRLAVQRNVWLSFRRTVLALVILSLLVPGGLAQPRRAVAEEKLKTLLIVALYGGAAGLLLGGVLTLVVDKDNRDDALRWGIVVGTFAGFAYGVYEIRGGSDEFSAWPQPAGNGPGALKSDFAAWADSLCRQNATLGTSRVPGGREAALIAAALTRGGESVEMGCEPGRIGRTAARP